MTNRELENVDSDNHPTGVKQLLANGASGPIPSRMKADAIMLVEDNPDDELLILRALKQNRICNPVRVARDGAEALDQLLAPDCQAEPLPAVVLLDLKLPKIDGLEVLRRLRAHPRTTGLPVVVLTSSKEQCALVDGYRLGRNSYVQKPVDFSQLVEATRYLGLHWLILSEPPHEVLHG